ncbi:MAG: hypothetical protein IJR90_02095, partial [Clostridia bacterium]|nr:hypothetical protein [Clostridia bacterium]
MRVNKLHKFIAVLMTICMIVPLCVFELGVESEAHKEYTHSTGGWYVWGVHHSVDSNYYDLDWTNTYASAPFNSYTYGESIGATIGSGIVNVFSGTAWNGLMVNQYPGRYSANTAIAYSYFQTFKPGAAYIEILLNNSQAAALYGVDSNKNGRVSIAFVKDGDVSGWNGITAATNALNNGNNTSSWKDNSSYGLSRFPNMISVTFASNSASKNSFDYYKVVSFGTQVSTGSVSITSNGGTVGGWTNKSNVAYLNATKTLSVYLKRNGGSADVNGNGSYDLYIQTDASNASTAFKAASGISLNNNDNYHYMVMSTSGLVRSADQNNTTTTGGIDFQIKKVGKCNSNVNADSFSSTNDHAWNSGTVTTAATCTTAGVKTYTCQDSDCAVTKTEAVAALGHSWGSWQ